MYQMGKENRMARGAMGEKSTSPSPVRAGGYEERRRAYQAMLETRAREMLKPYEEHLSGSLQATLLAVKGGPGATELAGGAPLSGPDGKALEKSLPRLGFDSAEVGGCLIETPGGASLTGDDLALVIAVIDPIVVVALDRQALLACSQALGIEEPPACGVPTASRLGPVVVAVDGFEQLLSTPEGKRKAWAQLRRAQRPGEPY